MVKLWDLRNTLEAAHIDTGRHAANKIAFDPSGNILSVASNNGSVKFVSVSDLLVKSEIKVSDQSCQAVLFDRTGEFMVASGNGTSDGPNPQTGPLKSFNSERNKLDCSANV